MAYYNTFKAKTQLKTSPFFERTSKLNESQEWRRWSGYLSATNYELNHENEYFPNLEKVWRSEHLAFQTCFVLIVHRTYTGYQGPTTQEYYVLERRTGLESSRPHMLCFSGEKKCDTS